MIVYTAKITKKKIVGLVIIAAVIIAAIILAMPNRSIAKSTAVEVKVNSDKEVLEYLIGLGYDVKVESVSKREVTIPKKFDEVYTRYNEMQKECGYDLSKLSGKKVMLYTYELLSHPESECALVEVMVYKTRIVGGSVYTKNLDGFMYGLKEIKISN